MENHTTSKLGFGIIVAWMLGLAFIIAIISAEKSKYKSIVKAFLSITAVYIVCVFILKFDVNGYIFTCFMVIFSICILISTALNFYTYKVNLKNKSKSIKVNSERFSGNIMLILSVFLLGIDSTSYKYGNTVLLITMLINLPMNYLTNYHINIYENGMLLNSNSFFKRLVFKKEIIPYEMIENITFSEYERGKYNLKIDIKENNKKHSYTYDIKKKDKDSMILFISDFIDKEKIMVSRHWKITDN